MKKITLIALAMLLTLMAACACAASIKLDSEGEEVAELQEMLKTLGYYSGNITGHAGPKTVEAIELFQEINGLERDGIAGPATLRKLEAIMNGGSSASSSSSSASSGSETVKRAQTILKDMDLYYGEITGNIGTKTTAAIKAFQKKHGLTQSGTLTSETVSKLEAAYGGEEEKASASQADIETVKRAQTILKKMDLYYGEITGNIGTKTTAAIKAFQKKHGLTQSGTLTSETVSKLEAAVSDDHEEEEEKSSASQTDAEMVKRAQTILRETGLYYGEITGNIGTKTKKAITAFQKKYDLTQSGTLTAETMTKLEAIVAVDEEKEEAQPSQVEAVRRAQMLLKEMGLYYGEITGNIGTKTKNAITAFQKKYSLTQSGTLTTETVYKLEDVYAANNEAEREESEVEESIFSSLRYGSTGDAVSALQENLTTLGYYYGEVTGHFGSKTRSAVRTFQKAKGLTADGIAGKMTLAAVETAIKNSAAADNAKGGSILDFHWFDEKSFYTNHGVRKGNTITVMDIVTGKMFNVRVQSTGYHADVEPKTAADTQIMCDVYGVDDAEDISYKRRAIFVKAKVNGVTYTYAASMYGEPHGSQVITDNDYEGQFCIHFRHSTTSETKIEYADNQDPIDKAVNYAVNSLGMTHVTDPDDL